jgi:hypothetical protein
MILERFRNPGKFIREIPGKAFTGKIVYANNAFCIKSGVSHSYLMLFAKSKI